MVLSQNLNDLRIEVRGESPSPRVGMFGFDDVVFREITHGESREIERRVEHLLKLRDGKVFVLAESGERKKYLSIHFDLFFQGFFREK
jgi:hypothetical protein